MATAATSTAIMLAANNGYTNFYLANEIEDQFNSYLDLQSFCTVDNTLVGTVGMEKRINTYKATDGTQKLAIGEGNTETITVDFTEEKYRILLAQNRFSYNDEQLMEDPLLVSTGTTHMATDMYNTMNGDIFTEFNKGSLQVDTSAYGFDAFVDASAELTLKGRLRENIEGASIFAFVHSKDMAAIRKALKDELKYVEAFVKTGYVGTIAGINLYQKMDAVQGTIVMGTKEAVTLFNKKGTEVEQDRVNNNRLNTIYSRKYYLTALTDDTKVVRIVTPAGADNLAAAQEAAAQEAAEG